MEGKISAQGRKKKKSRKGSEIGEISQRKELNKLGETVKGGGGFCYERERVVLEVVKRRVKITRCGSSRRRAKSEGRAGNLATGEGVGKVVGVSKRRPFCGGKSGEKRKIGWSSTLVRKYLENNKRN